jgi:hypothetical protein
MFGMMDWRLVQTGLLDRKSRIRRWYTHSDEIRATPAPQPSLTNMLSRNLPLPKYFSSQASSSQYHLPRKNPHAISSATIHRRESSDSTGDELSERFVVGWIGVEVDVAPPKDKAVDGSKSERRISIGLTGTGGIRMGTREERRSFGSDTTSTRTATPNTLRQDYSIGQDTPIPSRQPSNMSLRSASGGTSKKVPKVKVEVDEVVPVKRVERQLIAITYSGDWYRLRIPDRHPNEDEDDKKSVGGRGKCELLEYRRLGVGGGGW